MENFLWRSAKNIESGEFFARVGEDWFRDVCSSVIDGVSETQWIHI